jgi:hypothetical protein
MSNERVMGGALRGLLGRWVDILRDELVIFCWQWG